MNKPMPQTGDTQPLAAYDGNYLIDAYIAAADAVLKRQPKAPPEMRRWVLFVGRLLEVIGLRNLRFSSSAVTRFVR